MKKIIIIFLALLTFEAVGQTSSKGRTDWGPWNQHPCFKGLSFRFRCLGLAVSINKYEYAMQVKNDYPVRVSYTADCSEEGRNITNNVYPGGGLFGTNPGAITNIPPWYDAVEGHYINSGVILFRNVCFIEKSGCSNYCYAQCDERPRVPNQPDCNKKPSNSSNQNNQTASNQTPTQNSNHAQGTQDYETGMKLMQNGQLDEALVHLNRAKQNLDPTYHPNIDQWIGEINKAKASRTPTVQNNSVPQTQASSSTQTKSERTLQQIETTVPTILNLVKVAIDDFSREEYKAKFNGDLQQFWQNNFKCPAITTEDIPTQISLMVNPDGSIDDPKVIMQYFGNNRSAFLKEISRVMTLSRGNWVPRKVGNQTYWGNYFFQLDLGCKKTNQNVPLSQSSFQSQSEIEKKYIAYFKDYDSTIKILGSTTSKDKITINFNLFSVEIPIMENVVKDYAIVKLNDLGYYKPQNNKLLSEREMWLIPRENVEKTLIYYTIIKAFSSNNDLYPIDKRTFFLTNDIELIKRNEGFKTSNHLVSVKEKIQNTTKIVKIVKNADVYNNKHIGKIISFFESIGLAGDLYYTRDFYLINGIEFNFVPDRFYKRAHIRFHFENEYQIFKSMLDESSKFVHISDQTRTISILVE